MTAVIGAILGLLGSLLPEVLKFFNQKEDHRHEIEMAKIQIEAQKQAHTEKLEEINAHADIAEAQAIYTFAEPKLTGWKFIDGIVSLYQSSVRPTITYAFMALYTAVKIGVFYTAMEGHASWTNAVAQMWGSEDFAIFSTILAFWFGGRFMKYALNKVAPSTKAIGLGVSNGIK